MNSKPRVLRIAINAQILASEAPGGIQSVLIGLVSALGQLRDGEEEYFIIAHWQDPDWLRPYMGKNQVVVVTPKISAKDKQPHSTPLDLMKNASRAMARKISNISKVPSKWPEIPISDGYYESLGCNVIHFPYQHFVVCAIPTIFNPHDLQHRHYPQFFTPAQIALRETVYRAGCQYAHSVAVGSQWVKEDLVREYGLHPSKMQVIPWAPPTEAYREPTPESLSRIEKQHNLKSPFVLYPAITWPHKNHIRLLEAIALLRDRDGLSIRLVCTGHRYPEFWPEIEKALQTFRLDDQVHFLGMLEADDLRSIYRLAQFVIVPTLFEAASGPVFEAWQEGQPVACSFVTSLPDQAKDAALFFDPYSVEAIAKAIRSLSTDSGLRKDLAHKGKRRLQDYSWERTARAYRALYRKAAKRTLNEEDLFLLSWDWMKDPHRTREAKA